MKLLWLDLNSSYAHSSLALPALHAQIANNTDIEWCTVSATINENTGSVVNQIYRHQPDIIAATNWLFNHEQLLHIVSRAKALLPHCCVILGGPEFLGDNEAFLYKNKFVSGVFRGEGEEVFPLWLKVWNQPRKEWKSITGLCYLNESMLKQPDYPGYLHMLNNNATTTWEYWNGERSRVHNCYNGIANWFYQAVGGIRADEKQPGYRHVFIEPQIPQGVTWANTTKESPYGTIIVNWKLQDDCLMMHVVLPVGVEASVAIPSNANKGVVNGQEVKLDKQYLELGTGTYDIEIR